MAIAIDYPARHTAQAAKPKQLALAATLQRARRPEGMTAAPPCGQGDEDQAQEIGLRPKSLNMSPDACGGTGVTSCRALTPTRMETYSSPRRAAGRSQKTLANKSPKSSSAHSASI